MSSGKAFNTAFDPCINCSSKYGRNQSSICECKHCSKPFCIDCIKEHNDEMQERFAQLSDLCNQVRALLNVKRACVTAESAKSKEQMSEWLEKFIRTLKAEKATIETKIEEEEEEAQIFLLAIEAELQEVMTQIKNMTLLTGSENQQAKLQGLRERLECLKLNREYNLPSSMPKYTHQFTWSSNSVAVPIPSAQPAEVKPTAYTQSSIIDDTESEISDDPLPDENYFRNRDKFETTSYVVHCMASDGKNIMYTTIEAPQRARIAYCYLDTTDEGYRKTDASRDWLQSRIVDMAYWISNDTFVCATELGLRQIDHVEGRFRIRARVDTRWSDPRIAVNTDFMWIHAGQRIHVYDLAFQPVRTIDSGFPRSLVRTSFCLTDTYAVFAFNRLVEKDRKVSEVCFYDCDLTKLKTIKLGPAETPPMIRTDGNDRFFIATGQQRFLIVSPDGSKETVNLGKQASCLTVVNSRNVVLTRSRAEAECVKC